MHGVDGAGKRPRIRFGLSCRGGGKIFTQLEAHNARGCTWRAHATGELGEWLPCCVVALEGGEHVLVLAVLDVTQTVEVALVNGDGHVVAQAQRRVSLQSAKTRSRVNGLLRGSKAEWLRTCEKRAFAGRPEVADVLVVPGEVGASGEAVASNEAAANDRLRVHLEVPAALIESLSEQGSRLRIEAYDKGGKLLFSDACVPCPAEADRDVRDVVAGVPFARECASLALCLRTDAGDGGAGGPGAGVADGDAVGLWCFEGFVLEDMRRAWWDTRCYSEFDGRYDAWAADLRTPPVELAAQRSGWQSLGEQPLFSVVVPLYHTPIEFFRRMAQSVLAQTYGRWELILVNSTPGDKVLADEAARLASSEERVRVVTLDKNYGITLNTNAGIDVATGDFVCFFDHDDVLEPDLLYWYAYEVSEHPTTDLLYCDEDKVEDKGSAEASGEAGAVTEAGGEAAACRAVYSCPFFKPDWSPLWAETNNYVCHLLAVRRSLLAHLPRATQEFDGAQDHRLTLLAADEARRVGHIRRVLYHWRIHAQSTSANAASKPGTDAAGVRAVDAHLRSTGESARALECAALAHCYEVVGSTEDLPTVGVVRLPALAEEADVATAINDAVARCAGGGQLALDGLLAPDVLLLLGADVRLEDEQQLRDLVFYAGRKGVGVASGVCSFADGTKAAGALVLTSTGWHVANYLIPSEAVGSRGLERLAHEALAVSGACVAVRRQVWDEIGGVSAGAGARSWAIDVCLKARRLGLSAVEVPSVRATVAPSARDAHAFVPGAAFVDAHEAAWLRGRWPETSAGVDPYYSEHLDAEGHYGLRVPSDGEALRGE